MCMTTSIPIILLFLPVVPLHSSSYFKLSFPEDPREGSDGAQDFRADSELACALRCDRDNCCDEAIFDRASKKCSLHYKRDKYTGDSDVGKKKEKSRIWKMIKVIDLTNKKLNSSCSSAVNEDNGNTNAVEDQNHTTGTSCHDILQRNSSSPTGPYNISIGNFTWMTKCRMKGISRCGLGVWELIMKVKSSKSILRYDSSHWTSRASYGSAEEDGEFKLPGYWLRNFTRVCVTMNFTANASTNYTTILLNYSAQSLYSALHEGKRMALPVESPKITVPFRIDIGCLEKGLNIQGSNPWEIKSRVGIVSYITRQRRSPIWCAVLGLALSKNLK